MGGGMDKEKLYRRVGLAQRLMVPLLGINILVWYMTTIYPTHPPVGAIIQLVIGVLMLALNGWRLRLYASLKDENAIMFDERDSVIEQAAIKNAFYLTFLFLIILGLYAAFDSEALAAWNVIWLTIVVMLVSLEGFRFYFERKGIK
jgi:hypothetical protein